MKRKSLSNKGSKKMFSKHAVKTLKKNVSPPPMRGGIRL